MTDPCDNQARSNGNSRSEGSAPASRDGDAPKAPAPQQSAGTEREGEVEPEPTRAQQTEFGTAWKAFEAADALVAKAQLVRCMPPSTTVAEMSKRERLIADLEAQAEAVRPPPALTGKPIPERAARASISLEERSRGGGVHTGVELPAERRARRAARFGLLGGRMRKAGEGWHTEGIRGALAELVREEQAAGRPMSDKSDVRADLIASMEG